uniref:Uncharacterized protein n=1 Tax=Anguilla anguilla TaxID=7936 RepID=A0A0E9R6K7_ANGAN
MINPINPSLYPYLQ